MAIEKTKALFFPYPVYLGVKKDNVALEYDLGAAEGLLAELCPGMIGTANVSVIHEIADKIDAFAIDEALLQLNLLRERLNPVCSGV